MDRNKDEFGPFTTEKMRGWFRKDFFPTGEKLLVRLAEWQEHVPVNTLYPNKDAIFDGLPAKLRQPQQLQVQKRVKPQLQQSSSQPAKQETAAAIPGQRGRKRQRSPPPAHMPPYYHPPPLGYGPPPGSHAPPPPMHPTSQEHAPPPGPAPYGYGPPPSYPPPGYPPSPGYYPPPGYGPPAPGYYPPPGYGPPGYGPLPAPPPPSAPGRYVGLIKSYNPQKGFGFIDCPEARVQFGGDVFLHKAQISDLEVGDEVSFFIELNKESKPQARDTARYGTRYGEIKPGKGKVREEKGKGQGKGKKGRESKKKMKDKESITAAKKGSAPSSQAAAEGPEKQEKLQMSLDDVIKTGATAAP